VLCALLAPAASTAGAQQAPVRRPRPDIGRATSGPEIDSGSVLVTRSAGVAAAGLDRSLRARGLRLLSAPGPAGVAEVGIGGRPVDEVVEELRSDPSITSVSPNYVRRASITPNDPLYTPRQRTYAGTVRLPAAWDRTTGAANQVVAVLDTGVFFNHPDLRDKFRNGWDAVNGDNNPVDDHGHGTFVAGVAAGMTGNGEGTAGVSWGSRIIPVKVLRADGSGTDADVVEGIQWAVARGADVINLSLGGEGRSAALDAAVDYALDRNVTVIAAAGNDGVDVPNYPAASPGVVSVGATDVEGRLAHFSNWGDTVDLVAPGMDITSTARGGGYAIGDGTSYAAPLVAGVAALVRSVQPGLPARDVANQVINTAKDIGGQGRDPQTGRGLLDAAAAVGAKPRQGVAVPDRDAREPDGTPAKATPLAVLSPVSASIAPEGDVDWFRFVPPAAGSITFTVTPPSASDGSRARELDPLLVAYGPHFEEVGRADSTRAGQAEMLTVSAPTVDTYYLAVRNWFGTAGPGPYTVSVTVGAPIPGPQPGPEPPLADVWVTDTSPADFATGVAAGAPITLTMSRPLDPASVQTDVTVRLVGGITGRTVAATAHYTPVDRDGDGDDDGGTITIVPAAPLRAGLPYVVRVRNVVDADDGTVLTDLQRFRFTIAA
jgi:subtilisin family serine protease